MCLVGAQSVVFSEAILRFSLPATQGSYHDFRMYGCACAYHGLSYYQVMRCSGIYPVLLAIRLSHLNQYILVKHGQVCVFTHKFFLPVSQVIDFTRLSLSFQFLISAHVEKATAHIQECNSVE